MMMIDNDFPPPPPPPPPTRRRRRPLRSFALGAYVFMWLCMMVFAVVIFFEKRLNATYNNMRAPSATGAADAADTTGGGSGGGDGGSGVSYELMVD